MFLTLEEERQKYRMLCCESIKQSELLGLSFWWQCLISTEIEMIEKGALKPEDMTV